MRGSFWLGLLCLAVACDTPRTPTFPGVRTGMPDVEPFDMHLNPPPPDVGLDAFVVDAEAPDAAEDGPPPPPGGHLVINEVDYDQLGLDGTEFVEIMNPTADPVALEGVHLEYIDGLSGEIYSTYRLSDAGAVLLPGALLVLANPDVLAFLPMELSKVSVSVRMQNGPDALRLRDGGSRVIDSLSYGGPVPGVTEGDPPAVADGEDDPDRSIGRCDRGTDTDNNAADFFAMPPTPGRANTCPP